MTPAAAFPALAPLASATSDRWLLDAWLLWRDGSGFVPLSGPGQLGGSQAGARLQYDLTPRAPGRLAAYSRLTSALNRPAAPEAAIGLAYQPDRRIAFSVGLERRVALGHGARDAFAVVAAGGINPVDVGMGLRAEGYAQAGFVGFRRRDAFADGKLSVYRPLANSGLSAGVAISGGAQPHLNRLDIAPEVQMRFSVKNKPTKIAAEWRERVLGNARPGSGLTVTVAAGF